MSTSPCKIYLVTGANKGLGLALVDTILTNQLDATVIATVRAPATAAELLALEASSGGRLEVVAMDVKDEASVKSAAEKVGALPIVKECGIDMLVLNAGVNPGLLDTMTEIKAADMAENLQVNLIGQTHCVAHFLPLFRASQAKRIVYVSSGAGSIGLGFTIKRPGDVSSYGVSKAAANYYFVGLARELQGEGVHVALYSPGMVDTAQSQGVQIAGYPKLTPDQAADLWYEQLIVAPLKPTGSFFNEHGETLPW